MGALELRDSVLEHINIADERLLKVVKEFIEKYNDSDIVSYTINNKPLTRTNYKQELEQAKAEIKKGEHISQEDLEKESYNW